jgi:hypothetical protein
MVLTSLPWLAAPQQSLGDAAREFRQQQVKTGLKPTKVYTNDNLSSHKPDEVHAPISVPPSDQVSTAFGQTQATDSPQAMKPTSQVSEPVPGAPKSEKPEDENESKDYWQARFKSVRAELAEAQERQHLAEDELNLLQIQDARTLNTDVKAELARQISGKQDEIVQKQALTSEAQKALDNLRNEFEASGAPEEWSEESEVNGQESEVRSQEPE